MKILLYINFFLILAINVNSLEIPIFSDVQDIISLAHDLADLSSGRIPFFGASAVDPTAAKLDGLAKQISDLTSTLNIRMDSLMQAVMKNVPKTVQFNSIFAKFSEFITRIDNLYEDYLFLIDHSTEVNQYTIESFANAVTSFKYGDVQDILKRMYRLIAPGQLAQENQNLFELMMFLLTDGGDSIRCNLVKSPQQRLLDVYELVVLSEVKSFVMLAYSYGVLSIYRNSSFIVELDRAVDQVVLRAENYVNFTTDALKKLPTQIFLCDPPEHILGETYIKMTVFHMVVASELMLDSSGTCSGTCYDMDSRGYKRDFSYKDKFGTKHWAPQNPCRGRMFGCDDLGNSEFCEMPKGSDTYFFWVEGSEIGVYGNKDGCNNGTIRSLSKVSSVIYMCSACFCLCSEESPQSTAIRTLSLRPQMADIDNNMVVTGVRFEEKDKVIHIQIETGKLLPTGKIDADSVGMKELEDFVYMEKGWRGSWGLKDGDKTVELEENKDWSWVIPGQRDLYMDDVFAQESNYVVTGLRLAKDPANDKAVQLEVHITPFDYKTGTFDPTDQNPSKWITHKDMPGHNQRRKEAGVLHRDAPTISEYNNLPDSESNTEVWFVPSRRNSDAGQNTVPYIDRQLVAPKPRLPLEGVSLFHRGAEGSAGFFGLKLSLIDFSRYLKATMSPKNKAIFNNKQVLKSVDPQKWLE